MILLFEINSQTYKIDAANPLDISIALKFNGEQPNAYGVEKAASTPCQSGSLIGDTRRGGSCNFEQIKFVPHCNGTHTESIGHITNERISIHDSLRDCFIPATLVTIKPVGAFSTDETYTVKLNENDKLITKKELRNALEKFGENWLEGLIIRTLPNDESKKTREYAEQIPPFFSLEAMRFLVEKNVKHLLVDVPSIDRLFDEGKLAAHRIFWNVAPGSFELNPTSLINNTITEMIFAPDEIADGKYLLNLQIAPFASDASPSRPVLFEIFE